MVAQPMQGVRVIEVAAWTFVPAAVPVFAEWGATSPARAMEGPRGDFVNLGLSEDQRVVRDSFAEMLAKESPPERVRAAEPLGYDESLWNLVISTGALGVAVPEASGGAGAGLLDLALIATEVGRRLAPIPFAEPAAAARLLAAIGREDLLATVLDGSRLVSLALHAAPLEEQLLPDGAVADVVLALDGDGLVAYQRPSDSRPVANVGGVPLARWTTPGDAETLASGPEVARAYARAVDDVRVLTRSHAVGPCTRGNPHWRRVRERAASLRHSDRDIPSGGAPTRRRARQRRRRRPARMEDMLGTRRAAAQRSRAVVHGNGVRGSHRRARHPAQSPHPRRLRLHRRIRHPALLPTRQSMGDGVRRSRARAARTCRPPLRPRGTASEG